MKEPKPLQYAQYFGLASDDANIDIEQVLDSFSSHHKGKALPLIKSSSKNDLNLRCEKLAVEYFNLNREVPLKKTTNSARVFESANLFLSEQDLEELTKSTMTAKTAQKLPELPLPFITIGGGDVKKDVRRVRKSIDTLFLCDESILHQRTTRMHDDMAFSIRALMISARQAIENTINHTRLSLSVRAVRLLADNHDLELTRTAHEKNTAALICLENNDIQLSGISSSVPEPDAPQALSLYTPSPEAPKAKSSIERDPKNSSPPGPSSIVDNEICQETKHFVAIMQEFTDHDFRADERVVGSGSDNLELVAKHEVPPRKRAKHHHCTTESQELMCSTPPESLISDVEDEKLGPRELAKIVRLKKRRGQEPTSTCAYSVEDLALEKSDSISKVPIPAVRADFAIPESRLNFLVDHCLSASGATQRSASKLINQTSFSSKQIKFPDELTQERISEQSTMLEIAMRAPCNIPSSQDLLLKEPCLRILDIGDCLPESLEHSDNDRSQCQLSGGIREAPLSSSRDDTVALASAEILSLEVKSHDRRDDRAPLLKQETVPESRPKLCPTPVVPKCRIEQSAGSQDLTSQSTQSAADVKTSVALSSTARDSEESIRKLEQRTQTNALSSSLSCFLDLRGKRFRAPFSSANEVVDDPIEVTQQTLGKVEPDSEDRIKTEARPAKTPAYVPSIEPLRYRRTILINNHLLQHKPLLVQFLDRQGGENLLEIYRDFEQPQTDHADILLGPDSCIVFSHIQALGQRPLPGQKSLSSLSPVHDRLIRLSSSFRTIFVLVHFLVAEPSLCQLQIGFTKFCRKLGTYYHRDILPVWAPCESTSDTPDVVNAWAWKLISQSAYRQFGSSEPSSIQDETQWELFLRTAGINAFAAQGILSSMRSITMRNGEERCKIWGLRRFLQMNKADITKMFGQIMDIDMLDRFHELMHRQS